MKPLHPRKSRRIQNHRWCRRPWMMTQVEVASSVQAEARGLAPGSANSPKAKARGSVTDVVPAQDEEQDEERAQALAGGRGSSTGTSTEDGTPADGAQPAA